MTGRLIHGLAFDAYTAIEAEHFSGLKALETSPLHYHRVPRRKDTDALKVGRSVHAFVLDPGSATVAMYDGRRAGKAWEAFRDEHVGEVILSAEDMAKAFDMRAAVASHPIAGRLLSDGAGEVTMLWDLDGIACKARADWVTPSGAIVELKTSRKVRPDAFMREFASRLYHAQAAFYALGLTETQGFEPPEHYVITVENEAPFDVAVYRVGLPVIEAGARKIEAWMSTLKACRASGRWPGVGGDDIINLVLPDWALTEGLEDVELDGIGGGEGDGE